jgi:pilus assembly protein CpaE
MPVSAEVQSAMDIVAMTNAGTPIVTAQPNHPASRAFSALAATVTGEPVSVPGAVLETVDAAAPSRSLFRRGRS